MVIGQKIIVIERTYNGEVFEWEGEITNIQDSFIETKHRRNIVTHPQWKSYIRAYEIQWTRHFFHLHSGELLNIKLIGKDN